jgi:hypothetical protein
MEPLVTLSIHPIAPIPLYGSVGHTEGCQRGCQEVVLGVISRDGWLTGYPARDCVLEGCQRTYPHGILPQMDPRWGPIWGPVGWY